MTKIHPKELISEFEKMISYSREIDNSLYTKLDEIYRWAKDLKLGELTAKKIIVYKFIKQLINDSKTWISLCEPSSEKEKQLLKTKMTPTKLFWYEYLFPKWLEKKDEKLYVWKQKMMAGEFIDDDDKFMRLLIKRIKEKEGSICQRYIADLSMATDIVISNRNNNPLCVQVTTVSSQHYQEKIRKWKETLIVWEIERGNFISYDPTDYNSINRLINMTLQDSDYLKTGTYKILNEKD